MGVEQGQAGRHATDLAADGVERDDRRGRDGHVDLLVGGLPAGQGRIGRSGDGDDARVLATDGPERAQRREQPHHRPRVGEGERLAQGVGEVVLLDADLAHRLDLAGRPQVVPEAEGEGAGPGQLGVARLDVLTGLDELQPAELPHRLEHPVPNGAARVEHREQRLVDE